jgi:hypothetical protein
LEVLKYRKGREFICLGVKGTGSECAWGWEWQWEWEVKGKVNVNVNVNVSPPVFVLCTSTAPNSVFRPVLQLEADDDLRITGISEHF